MYVCEVTFLAVENTIGIAPESKHIHFNSGVIICLLSSMRDKMCDFLHRHMLSFIILHLSSYNELLFFLSMSVAYQLGAHPVHRWFVVEAGGFLSQLLCTFAPSLSHFFRYAAFST